MKSHLYPPLFALLLLAETGRGSANAVEHSTATSQTATQERRAQPTHAVSVLSEQERATLKQAQQLSPQLRAERAGHVGGGFVLGAAVVLLVLILL
ncbi:MAG: hypothetical protein K8S98_06265 [Planctomycetes bacterium]|nr:hypothetical protein [Planctomycetota bacterium]